MSRIKSLLLLSLTLLAMRLPLAAVTYYVGSCRIGSFATITEALAATPAPEVVKVCPGTYAEQIVITNPVTLEGIASGDAGEVSITVPSGGLSPINSGTIAVQVAVLNVTGQVNISNIGVSAAGFGFDPAEFPDLGLVVGVYYENSSGTLNHIETRFQQGNGIGVGVRVNVSVDSPQTVTIENSNLHSFDNSGISTVDSSPSSHELTLNIEGNTVAADPGIGAGINTLGGASVTLTGNTVTGPGAPTKGSCAAGSCNGLSISLPAAGSISKNSISGSGLVGILLSGGAGASTLSVTSNTIFDISGDAIQIFAPTGVIGSNTIMQSQNGIDFECTVDNNVKSNTIEAIHSVGLINVPAGVTSTNTYYNVPTITSPGRC
jgi:hypothetical protein